MPLKMLCVCDRHDGRIVAMRAAETIRAQGEDAPDIRVVPLEHQEVVETEFPDGVLELAPAEIAKRYRLKQGKLVERDAKSPE